jgi:hypothetical protein
MLPVTKDYRISTTTNVISILEDQEISICDTHKFIEMLNVQLLYFAENNGCLSTKISGWINLRDRLVYDFHPSFNTDEYLTGKTDMFYRKMGFLKVQTYLTLADECITLPLLSYMLLSISFKCFFQNPEGMIYGRQSSSPLYDLFGICVSGRSGKVTCKTVANIFFNFADRDERSIHNISQKYYLSSNSSKERGRQILGTLCDCPVLISATKKSFTKDSYFVSSAMTVHKKRDNMPYPVFVSEKPFYRDDIITVDISDANVQDFYFSEIKKNYAALVQFIKDFTDYLANMDWRDLMQLFKDICGFLPGDENSDYNKLGKYQLLLYAYKLFLNYGRKECNMSEIGMDADFQKALNVFKRATIEEILPPAIKTRDEPIGSFKKYIQDVFAGKLSASFVHWTGEERNPPHFKCYYVDYYDYWKDFERNYAIDIDKKTFEETLHANSIIYTKNSTRFDLERTPEKYKKHTCLVIFKGKLDNLNADKLLPPPPRRPVKMIHPEKKPEKKN